MTWQWEITVRARWGINLFHAFKAWGHYYSQGCDCGPLSFWSNQNRSRKCAKIGWDFQVLAKVLHPLVHLMSKNGLWRQLFRRLTTRELYLLFHLLDLQYCHYVSLQVLVLLIPIVFCFFCCCPPPKEDHNPTGIWSTCLSYLGTEYSLAFHTSLLYLPDILLLDGQFKASMPK